MIAARKETCFDQYALTGIVGHTNQIKTKQQDTLLVARHHDHQQCPNRSNYCKSHNDQSLPLEASGQPASADDGNDLDHAEGDVKKDGFEAIVTERLDDEVTKGADTTAGDSARCLVPRFLFLYVDEEHLRDSHNQEKPAPGFEIVKRLPDMVPSPLAGDDAHLIGA